VFENYAFVTVADVAPLHLLIFKFYVIEFNIRGLFLGNHGIHVAENYIYQIYVFNIRMNYQWN